MNIFLPSYTGYLIGKILYKKDKKPEFKEAYNIARDLMSLNFLLPIITEIMVLTPVLYFAITQPEITMPVITTNEMLNNLTILILHLLFCVGALNITTNEKRLERHSNLLFFTYIYQTTIIFYMATGYWWWIK